MTSSFPVVRSAVRRVLAVAGLVIGCSVASTGSVAAQQVVIDFENLACSGTGLNLFQGPYVSNGFSFATAGQNAQVGFGNRCTSSTRFAGSTALFNNGVGSTTVLSKTGGGAFSLFSISLAHFTFSGTSQSVLFTGVLPNSSLVFQTFTIPIGSGSPALAVYQFNSAFRNVTSVSWDAAAPFHQFDDVTANLSSVPEPATVALLATGMVAMAGAGYLRRRPQNDQS